MSTRHGVLSGLDLSEAISWCSGSLEHSSLQGHAMNKHRLQSKHREATISQQSPQLLPYSYSYCVCVLTSMFATIYWRRDRGKQSGSPRFSQFVSLCCPPQHCVLYSTISMPPHPTPPPPRPVNTSGRAWPVRRSHSQTLAFSGCPWPQHGLSRPNARFWTDQRRR